MVSRIEKILCDDLVDAGFLVKENKEFKVQSDFSDFLEGETFFLEHLTNDKIGLLIYVILHSSIRFKAHVEQSLHLIQRLNKYGVSFQDLGPNLTSLMLLVVVIFYKMKFSDGRLIKGHKHTSHRWAARVHQLFLEFLEPNSSRYVFPTLGKNNRLRRTKEEKLLGVEDSSLSVAVSNESMMKMFGAKI
jgi:hypothetical protein